MRSIFVIALLISQLNVGNQEIKRICIMPPLWEDGYKGAGIPFEYESELTSVLSNVEQFERTQFPKNACQEGFCYGIYRNYEILQFLESYPDKFDILILGRINIVSKGSKSDQTVLSLTLKSYNIDSQTEKDIANYSEMKIAELDSKLMTDKELIISKLAN